LGILLLLWTRAPLRVKESAARIEVLGREILLLALHNPRPIPARTEKVVVRMEGGGRSDLQYHCQPFGTLKGHRGWGREPLAST